MNCEPFRVDCSHVPSLRARFRRRAAAYASTSSVFESDAIHIRQLPRVRETSGTV